VNYVIDNSATTAAKFFSINGICGYIFSKFNFYGNNQQNEILFAGFFY
jgi:hypothetical protein